MLSVVSLVLLSVSIGALFTIKNYAANSLEELDFRSSSLTLYGAISEICALGSGNSRKIDLSGNYPSNNQNNSFNVEFDPGSSLVRFSRANYSIVKQSMCSVESDPGLGGSVYVTNENGIIKISNS